MPLRFKLPYNWFRFLGITTLFLLGYIVVIGIFGNVDISGWLPQKLAASIQESWPQLPFFATEKEPLANGQQEIFYTVPTRQFSQQELARMGKPAPAAKVSTPSRDKKEPAKVP